MQNFFEQVKISLANDITYFSSTNPYDVYIALKYRDNKVEMEYGGSLRGSVGPKFILSVDLGSNFDLEILPKSFFDRFFDIQAAIPLLDTTQKIKIKIPLLEEELLVRTNYKDAAINFLSLPEVSRIIYDYGTFFLKIENGVLKVYLSNLSAEKFEELRANPVFINRYLDLLIDLAKKTGTH